MAKKCGGLRTVESAQGYIASLADGDLLEGISRHEDPKFWRDHEDSTAYLRRWGCYLRREARRRGLL